MRKFAVALLAASGVALAAPAHAQGFWFGIGPFGFGVGAPYAYSYEPYWGGPYAYEPPIATQYVYATAPDYIYPPAYTYGAPTYETSYAYLPQYSDTYRPYRRREYTYSTYAYQPEYTYRRSVTRVYEPRRYRAHLRTEAIRAQASAPIHHVIRRKRIEVRHETR